MVIMWDRLLLVAGECKDTIQYPSAQTRLMTQAVCALWPSRELCVLLFVCMAFFVCVNMRMGAPLRVCLAPDPWCRYSLEEECVLVAELDGVRLVGGARHELLQEVPAACEDIFKIASMAPGALLLEAHKEYEVCVYVCVYVCMCVWELDG